MRLVGAVALALAATACGRDDADNMMAPDANPLSPEQVDLALGPEIANRAANELETTNELDSGAPASSTEADSAGGTGTAAAAEPEPEPGPEPETEPEDAPDTVPVANNSVEERPEALHD